MSTEKVGPTQAGAVVGLDHIAFPMQNSDAMVAFYTSLGMSVVESPYLVRVHLGDQMINFHRPALWQGDFPLRASAALPPCGDMCFVWQGSVDSLTQLLRRAEVRIVEGPVEREGGRRVFGSSVYVRDPDGNLIEFMTYPDGSEDDS
jgi:catechol 2,3-dioxygenase-like lactoylglutathione lyase family enzyme